jgi:hypothetical protein
MTTQVIPTIAIQEVYSGSKFTGVPSDGTPSEEQDQRGRIQKWIGGSVGGEFDAPAIIGMRVEQVWWYLDCSVAPNVDIYLVDDDGVEYLVHAATGSGSGSYVQDNGGFLVPPGFKVRVKSSQNINAVVAVAAEDTGVTGDGTTATYDLQLVNGRVDPGTVSIVAGTVTFTDPALDGVLVGTGAGGGSGTINYLTGAVEITLNTPSDFSAVNAIANYSYNRIGRVGIVIGKGWGQTAFSQEASLGREERPPAMQRA